MNLQSTRTTSLGTASLIAAAKVIPEGEPFFMLNMLRYKERAEYPVLSDIAPCSGKEAYHRGYVGWFLSRAAPGVEIAWAGSVIAALVAPADERWDEFVIVSYPSFGAFRAIVESPEYLADAAPHRQASLDDWRLIATAKQVR